MQEKQSFILQYGLFYDGVRHTEGELRLPTLADVEEALEEAGDGACRAHIDRLIWGRTITKIGSIPAEAIDASLLAGVIDDDYGVISAAEGALRKKLKGESAAKS